MHFHSLLQLHLFVLFLIFVYFHLVQSSLTMSDVLLCSQMVTFVLFGKDIQCLSCINTGMDQHLAQILILMQKALGYMDLDMKIHLAQIHGNTYD